MQHRKAWEGGADYWPSYPLAGDSSSTSTILLIKIEIL